MVYDNQSPEPEDDYEGLDLDQYKRWWAEAVDMYADARAQHIRDEEYYDGDVKGTGWGHWTQTQLATLSARGQPPTTRNMVARKVNGICGVEQRTRSEPRALPRTPRDQKAAEIATDALRFVKEQTRWNEIKALSVLQAVNVGIAAVEIGGAEDHVPITFIEWKDFFFDPRSRKHDFSDARYMGCAKWVDLDVAIATYAGPEIQEPQYPPQPQIPPQPQDPAMAMAWAEMAKGTIDQWQAQVVEVRQAYVQAAAKRQKIIDDLTNAANGGGSAAATGIFGANETDFEDRPSSRWGDQKRKRVFVVDMWHQDAKKGWFNCVFTGTGKLYTQPSRYKEKDQWGRVRTVCPIQAFSPHVSKDLWRFGETRGMRSTQDEVNFRLSKKIDLLYRQQLFYEPGAFEDDVEQVRRELSRSDGVVKVNKIDAYRIEKNLDLALALDAAQQDAMRFLDLEGANPELQGRGPSNQSGRAILARQQAGLGQLGPIFDRIADWELRCYRSMWARIQQFWTGPMYVRVTDDKNAARFAAVNGAPVIHNDNGNMAGPGAPPQMPPPGMGHNGGPPMGPEDMGEAGPMLAELDMDIIIDRAPEAATLQAEQYEALVQLAQGGALGPPGNLDVARMLISASALPNKSELLDKIDQMAQAQQTQQPNPAQMAELQNLIARVEDLRAHTEKQRAETAKIVAEIPNTHADTALSVAKARTEHTNATMTRLGAQPQASAPTPEPAGAPGFDFTSAPSAAAGPSGEIGLPPSPANGPPPF